MNDAEKPPFAIEPSADGTEIVIRLAQTELRVTAIELERAIAWLGLARASMTPSVAVALTQNQKMLPLSDFLFLPSANGQPPVVSGAALAVRSAYYGWFEVRLSAENCAHLVSWLSGHAVGAPRGATVN